MLAITVIEQLTVLSLGMAAGVGSGMVMARLAVDTASQTDSNVNRLPPIVFSTDWNFVGALVILLAAAAAVIVVLDVISVRKVDVANTLRSSRQNG